MTYREAIDRLYSLELWGIKLGLDNIRDFCRDLGDPQSRFPSIHIAGTNGKGSVAAFLDSILRAAGYKVGRYTSPHLRDFRERIQIDRHPVTRPTVTRFVDRHWPTITRRRYTFFEATTALCLDAFARAGVDVAVVEVGLGGRFDATNVVAPVLSIITRIAYDHEDVLGHSLAQIAFEKAGIIKPGVPVLTGPLVPEAMSVVQATADERKTLHLTVADVLADRSADVLRETGGVWTTQLPGRHQLTNLSIALAAMAVLRESGLAVPAPAIRRGVERCHWPGRFQVIPGKPTIVYDVAHNPDGIRAVVQTWRERFGKRRPVTVFTTKSDKNYASMVAALSALTAHWIGCPLPHSPGMGRETMEQLAAQYSIPFTWAESAKGAMRLAASMASRDGLVLVVGSHYLVGNVIPASLMRPDSQRQRAIIPVARNDLLAAARQADRPA